MEMKAITNSNTWVIISVFLMALICATAAGQTIFVDDDAPGSNNGSNWANAYNYLQDALAAASAGDEIRVAQGIYKPDQGGGMTPGDREATFQLINSVTIKGGYAGWREPRPHSRNITAYRTILSGDLNGDDVGDLRDSSRNDNSYHVVTGSGTTSTAVLDGFTITAGNAYSNKCSTNDNGGGMYNNGGSPTVISCTFTKNTAADQCGGGGGGMYNYNSSPTVINCRFIANEYIIADDDGGGGMCNNQSSPTLINCVFRDNASNGYGGGMLNYKSNAKLTGCTFINNSSAYKGGGIENRHSNPTVSYCVFIDNSTNYEGGGIQNDMSSPVLLGCTFIGNSASGTHSHGGGVCNYYMDNPTLISCLFSGNSAKQGGGMYSYWGTATVTNCTFSGNSAADRGGAMYYRSDSSTLTNCIVWGNTAHQGEEIYFEHFEQPATMAVNYSDIRNGRDGIHVETGNILIWGDGNINANPAFVEPGDNDLHLLPSSPCINAGDPSYLPEPNETDLDGRPRVLFGRIDMGAYEFNHIPVANAGEDQTVYAESNGNAEVTLDGTGSYDDDGHPLTYCWRWTVDSNSFSATGSVVTIELPAGVHTIDLIVSDGIDNSEPSQVVITVVEPMEAHLRIYPSVINRYSPMRRIFALVSLPEGITREQLDTNQPLTLYPGGIEALNQYIAQHPGGNTQQIRILALFDKTQLIHAVGNNRRVRLQVVGRLKTGQYFYGNYTVTIVSWHRRPSRRH